MLSRLARLFLIVSLLSGMFPVMTDAAPVPFPDMTQTWFRYREAVDWLHKRGVIGGYPDGTFKPTQTINRAELIKIVFKGKSDIAPARRRCFSDVSPRAWYAPYVCAAKNRGIVDGYKGNVFKPEDPVNMAEAIKIVVNAYGRNIDEPAGQNWYKPYVDELKKDGTLSPSYLPWEPLTRERAADLLWRVLRHDEERVNPAMSAGCGKPPPSTAASSITVNGVERTFLLTVPRRYVNSQPAPLILAFHGRTNSNEQVREYLHLDDEATDAIIAYPAAVRKDNGSYSWADPRETSKNRSDLEFFDALVERLSVDYCIDMDRVTVVGHSLGAWIANSLACVRGGIVQASATVGGDGLIADCKGPAAAFIAHNPKDNLAAFSGSEHERDLRLKENGCSAGTVPGPSELSCLKYTGCADGNDVVFCPHTIDTDHKGQYYPHIWPPVTAKLIVNFFGGLGKGSATVAER